eukprot:Rmarinus@m.22280
MTDDTKMDDEPISPVLDAQSKVGSLLRTLTVYDIIPASVKVVIFDLELNVRSAFYALTEHDMQAAPVFDSTSQEYVGMLTVSDFINILLQYHESPDLLQPETLASQTIRQWREVTHSQQLIPNDFVCIDPGASLFQALRTLGQYHIHRLPIVEPDHHTLLHTVTLFRILEFLYQGTEFQATQELLSHVTVKDAGIGTFDNLITAEPDTPVFRVLQLLSSGRVSAVPVIDKQRVVVDVYAKADVKFLVRDNMYQDLDITVEQALAPCRNKSPEVGGGFQTGGSVITCTLEDTLWTLVERFVRTRVHRLICVDATHHLLAVVSLSDLFEFFISEPSAPSPG